ncbi:hypothetical protein EHS25_005179 [Saitozyma podzolica]|uniref:SGNH hydrolase-type esterase domain-containing protein n=1 Tax=Saitozyma podzolica TaxID=1890683 RepID=A0A427XYZ4_9TREE|nr:hypothetical protein EHS25_005179 [Saitozyma podzolica]
MTPLFSQIPSLILTLLGVLPTPPSVPTSPSFPGTFLPFPQLEQCPDLTPRSTPPRDARDVRPDDIRVVAALGDSITAGFLARTGRDEPSGEHTVIVVDPEDGEVQEGESAGAQQFLPHFPWSLPTYNEYRGLSYPIGRDPLALTIPNILSHYVPSLSGGSVGKHPLVSCFSGLGVHIGCEHPEGDGTNAAISGSIAAGLVGQVRDYLVPTLQALQVKDDDWKFINLGIGANDICAFCLAPNVTWSMTGTPKQFARDIKSAVDELRASIPNVIVNIVGLFRVSSIYKLTLKDPYCPASGPAHLPLECSCALLPGPAGDYTRSKMDEMGEAYDAAVLEVIREWEEEADPSFGAIWQPGIAIDLEHWPVEALSPVDCFHPSEAAHQRVAAGIWNRLTMSLEDKARPIRWEDEVRVRCLEEGDRFPVGQISGR